MPWRRTVRELCGMLLPPLYAAQLDVRGATARSLPVARGEPGRGPFFSPCAPSHVQTSAYVGESVLSSSPSREG